LKRLRSAPRAEAPNPVMFCAGRFWLRAIARGSPAAAITNGTVSVAEHAASAAGVPGITMTSTCKLTNSLASSASVAATRRTIFEGEVLPLGIAMLEKHLLEGGKIDVARARGRVQKSDAIASDRRDRGRGPRLRKKAAYSRYKCASPHAPFHDAAKLALADLGFFGLNAAVS